MCSLLTNFHIVFTTDPLIRTDAQLAVALGQRGHVVILGPESALTAIVERHHNVRTNHLRVSMAAGNTERHVLVLPDTPNQLDDDEVIHHLPHHVEFTAQQLFAVDIRRFARGLCYHR